MSKNIDLSVVFTTIMTVFCMPIASLAAGFEYRNGSLSQENSSWFTTWAGEDFNNRLKAIGPGSMSLIPAISHIDSSLNAHPWVHYNLPDAFTLVLYTDVTAMDMRTNNQVLWSAGPNSAQKVMLVRDGDAIKLMCVNGTTVQHSISVPVTAGYHLYRASFSTTNGISLAMDDGEAVSDNSGTFTRPGAGFQIGSVYQGLPNGYNYAIGLPVAAAIAYEDAELSQEQLSALLNEFPATSEFSSQITFNQADGLLYAGSIANSNAYLRIDAGKLIVPAGATLSVPAIRYGNNNNRQNYALELAGRLNVTGTSNSNGINENGVRNDVLNSRGGILMGEWTGTGTYNLNGTFNAPNSYMQLIYDAGEQTYNISGSVTVKGFVKRAGSVTVNLSDGAVLNFSEVLDGNEVAISNLATAEGAGVTLESGTLVLSAGSEGKINVGLAATLKLRVNEQQESEGYLASQVTLGNAQNIVFIGSDGQEIQGYGNRLRGKDEIVAKVISINVAAEQNLPGYIDPNSTELISTLAGDIPGNAWSNVGLQKTNARREGTMPVNRIWDGFVADNLSDMTCTYNCNNDDMGNLYTSFENVPLEYMKCSYSRAMQNNLRVQRFTITAVPFTEYDVIVYVNGNVETANQAIKVNNAFYYGGTVDEANPYGTYETSTVSTAWGALNSSSTVAYGNNAIRVTGQKNSTLSVEVTQSSSHWGIAAIQIVENVSPQFDEPSFDEVVDVVVDYRAGTNYLGGTLSVRCDDLDFGDATGLRAVVTLKDATYTGEINRENNSAVITLENVNCGEVVDYTLSFVYEHNAQTVDCGPVIHGEIANGKMITWIDENGGEKFHADQWSKENQHSLDGGILIDCVDDEDVVFTPGNQPKSELTRVVSTMIFETADTLDNLNQSVDSQDKAGVALIFNNGVKCFAVYNRGQNSWVATDVEGDVRVAYEVEIELGVGRVKYALLNSGNRIAMGDYAVESMDTSVNLVKFTGTGTVNSLVGDALNVSLLEARDGSAEYASAADALSATSEVNLLWDAAFELTGDTVTIHNPSNYGLEITNIEKYDRNGDVYTLKIEGVLIDGVVVTPDADTQEIAATTKNTNIVLPNGWTVQNGAIVDGGSVIRGKFREYYDVHVDGSKLELKLNQLAFGVINTATVDDEEKPAIEVTEDSFNATITESKPELWYSLGYSDTLNGEYTPSEWTKGNGGAIQLQGPKNADGASRFYRQMVSDVAPVNE